MDFLRRAYARFHGRGLEILGIAFVEGDEKGRRWLSSYLEEHELSWPTVAAGPMWDSGPGALYEVHYIPFNFLLDREGRVVTIDVRGKGLDAVIEGLLGDAATPAAGTEKPGAYDPH